MPSCRPSLLFAALLLGSHAQWTRTALISQPEPNSGVKEKFGSVALSRSGLCGFTAAPSCGSYAGCQVGSVYALARASLGVPFTPANGTALQAPPGVATFGGSMAVSGDCSIAFVGAPSASSSQGRAFAFLPCSTQPSGWCLSATMSVRDFGLPTFGSAMATNAGGWAVAVAAGNSGGPTGGNGYGSVWFCTPEGMMKNASSWACEKLSPTGRQGDWLGSAVALSDDSLTLVATLPSRGSQGTVYVYERPPGSVAQGSGAWTLSTSLDPTVGCSWTGWGSSNRNFGRSVAMTGDASVIVVGAAQGGALKGVAVVFERTGAGGAFACTTLLRPARGVDGDAVGSSVAVTSDGNIIMVGSSLRSAFLFSRARSGSAFQELTPTPFNQPDQAAFNQGFSLSMALSGAGSSALIGAPGSSTAADTFKGYVSLYDSPPTPAPATPSPSPTGTCSPTAPPSPSPSSSPSPTPTATPSPSPTATLGASASDTPTPTASATGTVSPEAAASPSSTATPSSTPPPTLSPGASPSATPSATPSASPSATPSATLTATSSGSLSATASSPPSGAPSGSPSGSPTDSPSGSPTGSPPGSPAAGGGSGGGSGAAAAANQAARVSPAVLGGSIGGGLALLLLGALAAVGYCALTRRQAVAAQLTGASKAASAQVVGNPLVVFTSSGAAGAGVRFAAV